MIVHFQLFSSSWVVLFGGSIPDAHRGCFHIRKLFHCQNTLSNASLVMKKGKKKRLGKGWNRKLWRDMLLCKL